MVQTSLLAVNTFYSVFKPRLFRVHISYTKMNRYCVLYSSHVYKTKIYYKLHKREENRWQTLTTVGNVIISVEKEKEKNLLHVTEENK